MNARNYSMLCCNPNSDINKDPALVGWNYVNNLLFKIWSDGLPF